MWIDVSYTDKDKEDIIVFTQVYVDDDDLLIWDLIGQYDDDGAAIGQELHDMGLI